jgi:hypothetical protein
VFLQEEKMKKGNIIIGLFGIALSIFIWVYIALTFPPNTGKEIGTAFFPHVLSIAMVVFCVIQIIQTVKQNSKEKGFEFSLKNPEFFRVVITFGACIVFGLLFKALGFIVCAALLMMGLMYMLGSKKIRWLISIPVITAVIVQLLFEKLLGIMLPYGILDPVLMLF